MSKIAEKLKDELSVALSKVQRLYNKEARILDARQAAYTQLYRLKKGYKKIRLKEYRLVEQGLTKLESNKAKESSSLVVESPPVPVARRSPLATPSFDLFFSTLPNLLS